MGKNELNSSAIRKMVLDMAYRGSTAHIACAYSIVDILVELYRNHLNYDLHSLRHDYLILSKGHGVMALYAILNQLGFIDSQEISNYMQDGTRLSGLAEAGIPGVHVSSGSLGHGLSVGVGMALGSIIKGYNDHYYVIVGDGEMNEGSIWEAILFAQQFKLTNLTVIVDANGFQAMGKTSEIMDLGNLCEKFSSFGFECMEIDGHDQVALNDTIFQLNQVGSHQPKAIVAHTIKGKGLPIIENNNIWHYRRITDDVYQEGVQYLDRKVMS